MRAGPGDREERRFARVKVPPLLPRFVVHCPTASGSFPSSRSSPPISTSLFPAMDIEEHQVFRVTRNADLTVDEDEAEDLLAAIELELHRRRFGQAVRLEIVTPV